MENKYIALWKHLGLDLENHDRLLQSLSGYYKEVVLRQKKRSTEMNYFDLVVSEIHGLRIEELHKLRTSGNKVIGAFCLYVPEELVYAANATMVDLCGGANFPIQDAEAVLPRDLCPLIKSFFGFKIGRTCPYFESCDLLVGETTCDGKKKVYEILNDYAPTYVMEIPHKPFTPQAKKLWLGEMKTFKKELEKLTGNEITTQNFRDSIRIVNEKRKALGRLYEYRKNSPSPISGLDALLVTQIGFYDDVQRFTDKTSELCEELEKRVQEGGGVTDIDVPRLMTSGCPMAIPNWKVHSITEESGASVVVEESCTGTRYFSDLVTPKGETMNDLLEALVEKYSKIPCACFTPNDARVERILEMSSDFKVDGVIYYVFTILSYLQYRSSKG